jgi:probable biosynthetic protein (TIGR04098 family)
MCGGSALFIGQIGDWTWETVSLLCGTNVFTATNKHGAPSYLSFCYFRIHGSPVMNLSTINFGDRIQVSSRLFGFSSESILTLHKIKAAGVGPEIIDPEEFYSFKDDHSLYAETFNRWLTRSDSRTNENLIRSSPLGFEYRHLPALPDTYSPRHAYYRARRSLSFFDRMPSDRVSVTLPFTVEYRIDLTRDLNCVGLLYFATYFSILDWALLRFWHHLDRTDHSFLGRVVLDQRLCYLGNVNADGVLSIRMEAWQKVGAPADEMVNFVVADRDSGRKLAVSTLHLLRGAPRRLPRDRAIVAKEASRRAVRAQCSQPDGNRSALCCRASEVEPSADSDVRRASTRIGRVYQDVIFPQVPCVLLGQ